MKDQEGKVLVKNESETDPEQGFDPEKRPVQKLIEFGVVNVNKPAGPTAHQVTDYVKRIFSVDKAGHSGTLDPGVTGVLPIALAKATRIVEVLLKSGKEYVAMMHLHQEMSRKQLEELIEQFTGAITQLPPRRSAVKRQERQRRVYYCDILDIKDKDVLMRIGCQAGTYIRKLIHDMGVKAKVGAHMAELVRTRAGPFSYARWCSLQDVRDAFEFCKEGDEKELRKCVLPFEVATAHLKKVWVHDNVVNNVCHGASLGMPGVAKVHEGIEKNDLIGVMTMKGELICLGNAVASTKEMLEKEKGLGATTHKVFMERNTYKPYKEKG